MMTLSIKGLYVTLSSFLARVGPGVNCYNNSLGRHDTQHSDIQHDDTRHNDIQHYDLQHNDTQHNDIQHKGLICYTQ